VGARSEVVTGELEDAIRRVLRAVVAVL
jgi:hypothetical protein